MSDVARRRAGLRSPSALLATRSVGKLRELLPLLAEVGWRVETLEDAGIAETAMEETLEEFDSFEGNALAKARWFSAQTGRLVLADDSGLEVDALGGRPGVHSKRWSGRTDLSGAALDQANNVYLQEALCAVSLPAPAETRGHSARYVCAAACAWPEGVLAARGVTTGVLLETPRGTNGFGYDPYFLSDDLGSTFAEANRDAKAAVSHRGRAFAALMIAVTNSTESSLRQLTAAVVRDNIRGR